MVSAEDREPAKKEPEVPPQVQQPYPPYPLQQQAQQGQAHGRTFSTTVEVAAESRGKYFFLEGRKPNKVKELEMAAAIKQLRKIK